MAWAGDGGSVGDLDTVGVQAGDHGPAVDGLVLVQVGLRTQPITGFYHLCKMMVNRSCRYLIFCFIMVVGYLKLNSF